MKRLLMTVSLSVVAAGVGCTPASQNPQAIRQNTAAATETAKQDARAVVQGVYDGLRGQKAVNINTAGKLELEKLPGIDSARADRIIANRPYSSTEDLRKKGIVPTAEYNRIEAHIKTR
jgi:competence protein ComEA